MKKFLLMTALFGGVMLGVFLVMTIIVFFIKNDALSGTCTIELQKRLRLKEVSGVRIVLIGGSGLAYGVDSVLLSKELGRPVVNMGFNAGLGLCWQLWSAADDIHAGDLVVVSPEYSNFKKGGRYYGEAEPIPVLANVIPYSMWPRFPLKFWIHHLSDIPVLFLSTVKRKVFRLGANPQNPLTNYNAEGDYINHIGKRYNGVVGVGACLTADDYSNECLPDIAKFCHAVRSKGASLRWVPPVYHSPSFDKQSLFIQAVSDGLISIGECFCENPRSYRFDDGLIYDTPWHCNDEGRVKRTMMLVDVLRKDIRE